MRRKGVCLALALLVCPWEAVAGPMARGARGSSRSAVPVKLGPSNPLVHLGNVDALVPSLSLGEESGAIEAAGLPTAEGVVETGAAASFGVAAESPTTPVAPVDPAATVEASPIASRVVPASPELRAPRAVGVRRSERGDSGRRRSSRKSAPADRVPVESSRAGLERLAETPSTAPEWFDGASRRRGEFTVAVPVEGRFGRRSPVSLGRLAADDRESEVSVAAPIEKEPERADLRFAPAMALGIALATVLPVALEIWPASILVYSIPAGFVVGGSVLAPIWALRKFGEGLSTLWWSGVHAAGKWAPSSWKAAARERRMRFLLPDWIPFIFLSGLAAVGFGAAAFQAWNLVVYAALTGLGAFSVWMLGRSLQGLVEFLLRRLIPDFAERGWAVFTEPRESSGTWSRTLWVDLAVNASWTLGMAALSAAIAALWNLLVGMTWLAVSPAVVAAIAAAVVALGSGGLRLLLRIQGRTAKRAADFLDERGWLERIRWSAAGVTLVLGVFAAPTLSGWIAPMGMVYLTLVAFGAAGFIQVLKEAIRVAGWIGRWGIRRIRGGKGGAPGRAGRLRSSIYVAGLLLGLTFGLLPVVQRGPVIEKFFEVGQRAAARVREDPRMVSAVPGEVQPILRFLSEAGNVREIGGDFSDAVVESLSRNAEGRKLLDALKDKFGVVRMPAFFVADQQNSGAFENPVFHGVFLAPDYITAKGWTVEEFLADPAKQRELAMEIDQLLYHELTHTKQSYRLHWVGPIPSFFPGQFDHFPRQVGSILHLELEYEAHISDHLYLHDKLKEDPGGDTRGMWDYELFADDLDVYLKHIDDAAAYEAFGRVESKYYRKFMADIRGRWPRLSVEAYLLLAERSRIRGEGWAWSYERRARERAEAHGIDVAAVKASLGI